MKCEWMQGFQSIIFTSAPIWLSGCKAFYT
jgi:hypothetical protein